MWTSKVVCGTPRAVLSHFSYLLELACYFRWPCSQKIVTQFCSFKCKFCGKLPAGGTLRKADLGSPDLLLGQAGWLRISGAILLLCTMCGTMAPSATCGFKLIWKPGDLEFCFSDENHRTFSCSSMSPLCFSFYYDNSHCYLKEMRKPHHSSISCWQRAT